MIVCVHLECEEEKIICVHVYVEGIRNADIEPNTLKRFGFLSDFGRIVLGHTLSLIYECPLSTPSIYGGDLHDFESSSDHVLSPFLHA